jgi:hypothetical protein
MVALQLSLNIGACLLLLVPARSVYSRDIELCTLYRASCLWDTTRIDLGFVSLGTA